MGGCKNKAVGSEQSLALFVNDDAQDVETYERTSKFDGSTTEVSYNMLDQVTQPPAAAASATVPAPKRQKTASGEMLRPEGGARDGTGRLHCVHTFEQLGLSKTLTDGIYNIVILTFSGSDDAALMSSTGEPEVTAPIVYYLF